MDRQALIDAAIAYARSNEDTPATKNLAELHARMAISLLTGEIGMYDSSFLTEDAETVTFFDQVSAAPVIADDADWYPTFAEMGAYLSQIAGPGATVSAVKDTEDWRVDFPFDLSIEICWVERQTVTRSELKEILRRQVEIYFRGEGKACAASPADVGDLDREL